MELIINKPDLRVFFGSDFHSDFWHDALKPFLSRIDIEKYDLFLFAGDVSEWNDGNCRKLYDHLMAAGKAVVMVAGNHEFYDGQYQLVKEEIGEYAARNELFYFLDGDYVDLPVQKIRIWGDTLWTDFRGDLIAYGVAERTMNDYRKILFHRNTGGVYLEARDTVKLNNDALSRLPAAYGEMPSDWRLIVMTHHAPFPESTPKQYRKPEYTDVAKLNKAYSNDLYDWCQDRGVYPAYWIHGHIHDRAFYQVEWGEDAVCTVVSNPFGYPGEKDHDEICKHWLQISSKRILVV